jgi:hypothetical protein
MCEYVLAMKEENSEYVLAKENSMLKKIILFLIFKSKHYNIIISNPTKKLCLKKRLIWVLKLTRHPFD